MEYEYEDAWRLLKTIREHDRELDKRKRKKRRVLTKHEKMALFQKAVDRIRDKGEVDIYSLSFFLGVSPYFLGKNAGLIMQLFEDIRFDPEAKTFYIIQKQRR